MATHSFDPTTDGIPEEVQRAEAEALKLGEQIVGAQEEDRARKFQQVEDENGLIAGKFKTQDDLLKAYEELQKKLSKGETVDETEEPSEEPTEAVEEAPVEEEVEEAPEAATLTRAAEEYAKGEITEETIEELSKMDSKDLIKSYIEFYSKSQQQVQAQTIQEAEVKSIKATVGGDEGYGEMMQWAGRNLSPDEIAAYNNVANSGNAAALRFAVEALSNRYKAAEGYEAPLVSGRKAKESAPVYRSHAELARDIADPRYQNDPAFRQDVETKLGRSTNLL